MSVLPSGTETQMPLVKVPAGREGNSALLSPSFGAGDSPAALAMRR